MCALFFCVYLYRNVCGIVLLCAEVSLHNRVGWRESGGADSGDGGSRVGKCESECVVYWPANRFITTRLRHYACKCQVNI